MNTGDRSRLWWSLNRSRKKRVRSEQGGWSIVKTQLSAKKNSKMNACLLKLKLQYGPMESDTPKFLNCAEHDKSASNSKKKLL